MRSMKLMKSVGLGLFMLGLSSTAWSHGFLSSPEARGSLCRTSNTNCGAIVYEPQSLEAVSGFPKAGPVDGKIASAALPQFAALDEQTSSRWAKRPMSAGLQNFTWTLTANHVTRGFRYYITKANWNPNQVLSRASFEAAPFCEVSTGMVQPPKTVTHQCNVPARTGYQIILAVWEIGDTVNSFYNVADVMFGADTTTPPTQVTWNQRGTIFPSLDLTAGDQVATRVFDASGERRDLQTRINITNSSDGQRNSWPFILANRINLEQAAIRAGQKAANGKIEAVSGQNEIFTRSDSGLSRVEIQIEKAVPPTTADLAVSNLAANHVIKQGQLTLSFDVRTNADMDINVSLFNSTGQTKGVAAASVNNSNQTVRLNVTKPEAGRHQIVFKATVKATGALVQKTFDLNFQTEVINTGAQYRFPENVRLYKAGTVVLQPKNGMLYQCRPFPYSGFCVQWSPSTPHFEPGVGSNWKDAWIEISTK